MNRATAPMNHSAAPTISPVAVSIGADDTDSLVSGPLRTQIMLKLKKVVINSRPNSFNGSAPVVVNSQRNNAVPTNDNSSTDLRPNSYVAEAVSPIASSKAPVSRCCALAPVAG